MSSTPSRSHLPRLQSAALSRRRFVKGGLTMAAALPMAKLLAACGDDTNGADPDDLEGASIVATYMAAGTYDAAAADIVDGFTSETGIEVDLVTAPFEVLNQNHITDLTTETGEFDVMSGEWWIAPTFRHMRSLEDFLDRDDYRQGFIPELLEPGPSNYFDGEQVGLPYAADAYGILYRTDLFEEAGVEANWETWDDIFEIAEALGGVLPDGVSPLVFAYAALEQIPSIFNSAYDGYFLDANDVLRVDPERAIPALEATRRTVDYAPGDALGLSIDEANAVFLQGDAAMLIGWPSFVRAAADSDEEGDVAGRWRLAHMPGPGFTSISCWNHFISDFSDEPEASWEWIKAYANPENAKQFMEQYGIGSPFADTYEDEELLEEHEHDYPQQMDNLARTKATPHLFEAFDAQFRILGDFLQGDLTPEETVEAWHGAWEDLSVPDSLIESAEAQGLKAES